jgi:osmotically-inducible protein OsmY
MNAWMRAIAVMGLLAVCGCTPGQKADVRENVKGLRQEVGHAAQNVGQAASNAALVAKVKSALATRKGLEGSDISVEASGSVVSLKGTVASREQGELAERVAAETEGVTSVQNQLAVKVPIQEMPPSGK